MKTLTLFLCGFTMACMLMPADLTSVWDYVSFYGSGLFCLIVAVCILWSVIPDDEINWETASTIIGD